MSTEKIAHIQFNKNECNQTIPIGRERDRFPLDLFQSASDRFKFIFENICTYMRMCSRVCSIQCIEGRGQGRQTRPLSSLYWQLEKDRIDGAIAYILLGDCMRYSSSIIDAFFLAEWETIVCAFFLSLVTFIRPMVFVSTFLYYIYFTSYRWYAFLRIVRWENLLRTRIS